MDYIAQTTQKVEEKQKEELRLIDFITCVFCAYMFSGNTGNLFLYISLGLFVIWLVIAYVTKPGFATRCINDKKIICLFVVILYSFMCGMFNGSVIFLIKQVGATILLYSPIFIFDYYCSSGKKSIKFIVGCMLLCWVYFSIKAIIFFTVNVGSAKTLTADSDAYGSIAIGGGLLLAYATAIFSNILVDFILQKRKRVICILLLILSIYLLFKTESTVTLVCTLCGMAFSFISAKGSNTQKYLRSFISIVLIVLFVFNLENIGRYIVEFGVQLNSTFGNRVKSFGYVFMGDADRGSYAVERGLIMLRSLETFFKYPLTGVCYQHGNGFYPVEDYGIGNHCAWIDAFANYGVIVGAIFCLIYVYQIREIKKNKDSIFSKGWVICLILMGLFNPIKAFHPNLLVFFIIPALNILIGREKKL